VEAREGVFMKNKHFFAKTNVVLAGMLAAALAFGLTFLGCENGNGTESTGNTDPKTIVIEGISEYTDQGSIRVFSDLNDIVGNVPKNAGIGYAQIADGKLTVELTVPSNNTASSQTKWTGYGSYYVYFMPYADNKYSTTTGRIYVGTGGTQPKKYNINEAVTTLSYNDFKQYNVWKN
jgi:hypothetical protein